MWNKETSPQAARLSVDLAAIRANYALLNSLSANAECAVVLKANAYGIGVKQIAPELYVAGARTFFVAFIAEAIELLESLNHADNIVIYVLEGNAPGNERGFSNPSILPVINSLEQLERWQAHCASNNLPVRCGLHVDTGMNRLGLSINELFSVLTNNTEQAVSLVMSHLSCADDPLSTQNSAQLDAFRSVKERFPKLSYCLANSAGMLLGTDYLFDMVRAGVALFGIHATRQQPVALEPAIKLEARLIQIKTAVEGETIGYGATYKVIKPMRLGTLSIGYADGYLRSLSGSQAAAFFHGRRFPLVGRVSMDAIVIDLGDADSHSPRVGEYVELINETLDINELAGQAGTIAHEILTSFGNRLHWVYLNNANAHVDHPNLLSILPRTRRPYITIKSFRAR